MQIAEVVDTADGQTVHLPDDFRLSATRVSIRREGEAVILEPLTAATWPAGFFEKIHIDDHAFARPSQGEIPPV